MTGPLRVLYVDDEPGLLEIGKIFLEKSGDFTVTTVMNAPDAIRLLEGKHFDVIVSDYQMPGLDGIQFLVEVRKRFGAVPFILFTGKGREEVVIQAINKGADFYLQKGGNPMAQFAELANQVRQAASRKRAEDSLKASEEKYRQLVELAKEGIWAIDTGYNTTYVNPRMAEMLQYTVDEMLGLPLISFMDDAGKMIFEEKMERRRQGIAEEHPFEFITKGGGRIYVTISTSPLTDDKGVYQGAIAVISDITGNKQANEALAESETRYRTLAESSTDNIFIIGRDDTIRFVNTRAAGNLHLPVHEIIGKPRKNFFHPGTADTQGRYLHKVFETGETVSSEDKIVFSNQEFWLDTALVPLKDETGTVTGVLGVSRDITGRKVAEESLRRANKKLNLLFDISRQGINRQLSVLTENLRILQRKQADTAHETYLQNISTAARRISGMVRFTSEYEKIGVNASAWLECRTLADNAATQAPLGTVRVDNDLPAGTEIFADPLVTRVFITLMENAVRYGDTITTIRFTAGESGEDYRIVCEDDGVGIPAFEKEKIFDRGFGKNTGMGLFLSREILAMTGITIRETGEPGKGARIEMTVPKGMWRMTGKGG